MPKSVDHAYLRNYEEEELEQKSRFETAFLRGETNSYPAYRFRNIKLPVAHRAVDSVLWPQIPMFGSVIVPIFPTTKESFADVHKFDTHELDRLIDIWKESGRVQFSLAAGPTRYEGLDFLERLLTEVKPVIGFGLPLARLGDGESTKKIEAEFDAASSIAFWPYVREFLGDQGLDPTYVEDRYNMLRAAFVNLRLLGFTRLTDSIMDTIGVDPADAYVKLLFNKKFLLNQLTDPIGGTCCFSLDELRIMKGVDVERVVRPEIGQLPNEIGAFLLKELTPYPERLTAGKNLI